jgi:hypothetical protein
MTINNSKSVINLKIIRRISIILYLSFLLLTFVAMVIKFPFLGISKVAWTVILTACFIIIIFLPAVLNYQYIYFSDEGDTIIFRYYATGFIEGNKHSVEIGKKSFSGFTLDRKFLGMTQSITLYQRTKEGVAKYPSVYINALNRQDKKKIIVSLNSYAPRVKAKKPV